MTQEISLNDKDIVIYALYALGGYQRRVHTEDIALKCYEIAPARFSWTKYPQYPDIQPVRFALEKCKPLIVGSSERKLPTTITGWRLTSDGIQWMKMNLNRIERQLGKKQPPTERLVDNRRIKVLINSKAFNKYLAEGEKAEISHAEFAESLVCTVNTKPAILSERIEQLHSAADLLNQDKVKQYLNFYRKLFAKQLRGGGDG
jgi:hypothetical protein